MSFYADSSPVDLILYCNSSNGGIADYAHHQAIAFADLDVKVVLLCPDDFQHVSGDYQQVRCLPTIRRRAKHRVFRLIHLARCMLLGYKILQRIVLQKRCKNILLASYSEYLAPLWAWRFRSLRRSGVQFAAIAHDPVRDFVVGPLWWHRWSISQGFSFLDHVFVHEKIALDTGHPNRSINQIVIPHGAYPFPDSSRDRITIRQDMEIPTDAVVYLSFGHLRDGKNLKLVLQAMVHVTSAWLVVAGTEAGTGNIKSAALRELAEELGVSNRCRWIIGYIDAIDVANLFCASDFVLLTYSKTFRSASGVLNIAVHYQKPILASCGQGNLSTSVRNFSLGVCVEPDCVEEIVSGMLKIQNLQLSPKWIAYSVENCWRRNAMLVMNSFKTGRH
jgi:glycosyltransferase involved in cell wall biosynthesis